MYWDYFKYIVQHKWFVFIECLKIFQPIHGIMHDMSKFRPSEFFPYAKVYGGDYAYKYFEVEQDFDTAWLLHQHRNKHHWDYWVGSDGKPVPIPPRYIKQMIADWRAMGRKFGDTALEYYQKNNDRMILAKETRMTIEYVLDQDGR
jgi:hypothetical protein